MNDSQAPLTPLPRPVGETRPAAAPDAGGALPSGSDAPGAPGNSPAASQEPPVTIEEVSGWAMGGSSLPD